MIQYLRIAKNKFWGWVFASLAIGVLVGAAGAYVLTRSTTSKQVAELRQTLELQAEHANSSNAALKAQLASTEASLTALGATYSSLVDEQKAATTSGSTKAAASTANANITLEVQQRSVRPSVVATGGDLTLSVRVQGHPTKVTMRIYDKAVGYDQTFALSRSSKGTTTETWRGTATAWKKRGTYHYYATAYQGTKSATQPGASPASFKVD